jgi:uncharacterized membrane protein
MTTTQEWYRSLTTWLAIAGQALSFLVLIGIIDLNQSDVLNGLLVAVGEVLVLVGIFNNPTRNHVAARKLAQETRLVGRK